MRKRFIYNLINVPLGVLRGQRGGSIIAAVFLIVVIGFLGAIVVSLVSTQSFQSVGELKSTEALYIADGGIEYALKTETSTCGYAAPSTRPFPNFSCPEWSSRAGATVANPCPSGSAIALGNGSFCVDPPTVLTAGIGSGAGISIPVVATAGFPAAGLIRIDNEVIRYTSTTATTFVVPGIPSYRGYASTTAAAHILDAGVYPVVTLNPGPPLPNNCTALASISIDSGISDTSGFLSNGVIKIDSEYFHYTGKTAASFTGVTRCFRGSTSAIHNPNTAVYQQWITSTGSVSSLVGGTAQRVVRVTVDQ